MSLSFSHSESDTYVPWPDVSPEEALARTTHLCIGAHPDDIEAMAVHGMSLCFGRDDLWFTGVTVTDGAGSARTGPYAGFTDAEMRAIRRREQRKAAFTAEYSIQIQLGYSSAEAKERCNPALRGDLARIFEIARPQTVYLHQPADKHDTHVAVLAHSLAVLRALPPERQPETVYGCEGWRGLDWLDDADKQLLGSGENPVIDSLYSVFDSQNRGGKRYDIAVPARRRVNATFLDAHTVDAADAVVYALDLTPLMRDPGLSVAEFIQAYIDRLRADVTARVGRYF